MSIKTQKSISIVTSVTTTLWLSGVMMLAPLSVGAVTVVDGDLIRNPNAEGMAQLDIYIAKTVGDKKFKRLILSPHVFESYAHFDKNGNGDNWDDVMDVDQATMDSFTTTDLVREDGNDKVYRLYAEDGADTGIRYWLDMTAADFTAVFDADAIYTINSTDTAGYTGGADVADASATFPPAAVTSEGTLTVALASDTPAAGTAVQSAARLFFTKVNLTATGGDVVVDSLVVERVGLANNGSFASLDVIDGDTSLPLNNTSKTFNSLNKATFTDDFTIADGTTKSIVLAGNMAASLTAYSGEVPALALVAINLKGDATTNVTLPITGNSMTINSTITIGSATIQRGAYVNATSTSIQVGKEDYTFFSFQVAAGSVEKVEFSQVKVYQQGSASLGTDVINFELLQDGTKIADGVIASSKYVNFSFDTITLDKGQTNQFQVKADVADGSVRTIDLGIYKTTDLLVKGVTYGYNITPTYSSTGSSSGSPVLSDNQFTISNGTLQVTRSNDVAAGNISVGNDQYLGAFTFEVKGEPISISAANLTITSSGAATHTEDALSGLELVDASGNVVAGPTDITNNTVGTVAWTDTFTAPIGTTVYKVRGDLSTSGGWASNDTVYVSLTPSGFTATGDVTGNTITPSPSSALNGNTQTVKAASLTVTKNTLPATATIVVNQNDVVLSSWNFDATASGEDIRVTSVAWAGRGNAATNTNALTTFIDENKNGLWDSGTDTALSPVNDAISSAASSTFAFTSPIIVPKGTSIHVALKGDKDTVSSNETENWGLGAAATSVIAYGATTGNSVTESLTPDNGPTLTSAASGTLTIETTGNPSSAIVLAGTSGNVFTNVNLAAKYEDLRVNNMVVHVGDGSYSFNSGTGGYMDITNVSLYDGTTLLKSASISSLGYYKFEFSGNSGDADYLKIPKGGSKTITIKSDMSTIDPDTDNAPGTGSADLKIGFGGTDGVKTTGTASNTEITGSNESYRSSTSSAMVLRISKPVVTLPSADNRLGAAATLTNNAIVLYAYKVTADASGGDVLLFRNTFVVATSGSGMTVTNMRIVDEDSNTIGAASTPTSYNINNNSEYYDTFTFDSPDISNGDDQEAIKITAGTSKTFKLFGTINGASSGENFTTFLVGDTASTSAEVNTMNKAKFAGGWVAPVRDLANMNFGNFIWSDNYKNKSITGTGGNNATDTAQWYNGHLVSGLGNVVSTTAYTIGW
jgi:hypothetical protein